MMKKHLLAGLIVSTLSSSLWAASTSTLIGFAKLDVETYAEGPSSGSAVKGANGIFPPFKAQPVRPVLLNKIKRLNDLSLFITIDVRVLY